VQDPVCEPGTFTQNRADTYERSVSVKKMGGKTMYAEKSMRNTKEFEVYRFVFETAIEIFEEIFETSKNFPKEKKFLTDQVRRYSRSVCTNLAEAWHMKKNKSSFINKLSDAAQAASRTQLFLEYASKCKYIDSRVFRKLDSKYEDIFDMLCDVARH
jgi:four helix bundle protein